MRDLKQSQKLSLIFIVAALLRLINLGKFSLWLDEYTSIEVATKSLSDIINGVGFDSHTPPFYYLILHFWFALLNLLSIPISEVTLRLPSVAFDLIALLLLFSVSNKFFNEKTALIATAIYAVLEFPIYFAQEGRMYSLLAMECLLVLHLLYPLDRKHFLKSLFLAAVICCGLYTHYYFAFFSMGLGLALLFDFKKKGFWTALLTFLIGGIGFLPWINVVLKLAASKGQTFREFSILSVPYSVFRFLAGYAVFPLDAIAKSNQLAAVKGSILFIASYGLLSTLLILLGLYSLRKARSYFYILFPLLTCSIIPLLISIKTPMFSERYLSGVLPLICILFALALDSLIDSTRKLAIGVVSLSIFYALFCHYGGEPRFKKEQWRDVVALLRERNLTQSVYVEPEFFRPILSFYCPECQLKNIAELPATQREQAVIVQGGIADKVLSLTPPRFVVFPAESGLAVQLPVQQ